MQEGYLLDVFSKREYLLDAKAVARLCALPEAEADAAVAAALKRLEGRGEFLLTEDALDSVLEELVADKKAAQPVVEKAAFDAVARSLEPQLSFRDESDVTAKSTCTGSLDDFVRYFNDRFSQMRALLRNRQSQHPHATCAKARGLQDRTQAVRVIGMVSDKRTTKNGHLLVELEDESGVLPCLFSNKNPQLYETGGQLLLDEVVAVDGVSLEGLFLARGVTWPDLPFREKKLVGSDACIAFISDLHVGSKYFLRDEFNSFLKFLNGEGPEEELAGRIKYLLIAGDVVDGIGVYPSQEKQLVTKDIYEQYEVFASLMGSVPDWVEVVIAPGNHDAVRTAEPQPRLPQEFAFGLDKKRNFHFVGNPAVLSIEGLSVLMYHGTSLDTLVSALPSLRSGYQKPETVAEEMLKRRHLCPIYGEKPIVPERKDYMVIGEVPDLFHFGHVHKNGYSNYRGTTIINSGAWQSTTDYQLRQGHVPTPCQLPVYDLRTATLRIVNFSGENK